MKLCECLNCFADGIFERDRYTETSSREDFREKYDSLISALIQSDFVQGYCYTQLTDVEQEQNGLLSADREIKWGEKSD